MTKFSETVTGTEIARLSEREALQRLDLLGAVSRILDDALDEYAPALVDVAGACVPDFADLCAIEVLGPGGDVVVGAYRVAPSSGLQAPRQWVPIGRACSPDRRPALGFAREDEPEWLRGP